MQKKIFLVVAIIMLLTGCRRTDSEIIFEDDTLKRQEDAAFLALPDEGEESGEADKADQDTSSVIFVYVCGEVESPGVYELSEGSRVIDAVSAAGGVLETADDSYINLAAPLEDGIKLRIPSKEDTCSDKSEINISSNTSIISRGLDESSSTSDNGNNGLVNINTASLEQLKTLPGIGEGIAGKIIKYREENGRFSAIEDIMKVSGIKDKLFQKIKDQITV